MSHSSQRGVAIHGASQRHCAHAWRHAGMMAMNASTTRPTSRLLMITHLRCYPARPPSTGERRSVYGPTATRRRAPGPPGARSSTGTRSIGSRPRPRSGAPERSEGPAAQPQGIGAGTAQTPQQGCGGSAAKTKKDEPLRGASTRMNQQDQVHHLPRAALCSPFMRKARAVLPTNRACNFT